MHREAMKKISEIRTKDYFKTRKSPSRRSFNGDRSSKNLSPSRISREETKDMRRVKRVRFADHGFVYQDDCKPDASSIPSEGTQTKKFDDPKTLEYASYKRLREETGRSFHFHNRDGQLKKAETSNCSGEVDHLVKYRCEEVRPLLPVKVTPTDLRSSCCLGEASKNPVTVTTSSKHLEPHPNHAEVFCRKRQKLRQWVAEALSLDVDEISSKGYDVVSVLLQRLVPQCNASKSCIPQSSRYEDFNTRSQLHASPDSDTHFGELPWTPTPNMHFIEPTSGHHLDDDSSECRSNKSGVVTSSQWDIVDSDSLSTRNADIFDSQWGHHLYDDSSEYRSNKSGVDTSSQWDIVDSDSLSTRNADIFDSQWDIVDNDSLSTRNTGTFDFQYRKLQPYCASDDENATVLYTKMKPCWLMDRDSLKRNGSLAQDQMSIPSKLKYSSQKSFSSLWHLPNQSFAPSNNLSFPGLDEFREPKDFAPGIEHFIQFLDRNDGDSYNSVVKVSPIKTIVLRDNHEQSLSKSYGIGLDSSPLLAIHNCDQNDGDLCNSVVKVSPIKTIVLRDNHEQNLSKSYAIGLDSSPLLAIHNCASMTSLLNFWSERYPYQTTERCLEENDYSVAVMDHHPLTLSCCQSYYPRSHCSLASQVFNDKLCSNVDTLVLPSGLESDFGSKNLLMNDDSLGEHHSSIFPNYRFNTKQTRDVSSPILTEEQSKWSMDDDSRESEMQSDLAEETSNIQDFRISLNRVRFFPLLFDKSSCG